MGISSFAVGLIALAASAVPLTGAALAVPAIAISAVLGGVALRRGRQKRMAMAGCALSGLSVVVVFVVMPVIVQA